MVDYNSDFDLINDGDCEPYEKLVQKKNCFLRGQIFR